MKQKEKEQRIKLFKIKGKAVNRQPFYLLFEGDVLFQNERVRHLQNDRYSNSIDCNINPEAGALNCTNLLSLSFKTSIKSSFDN